LKPAPGFRKVDTKDPAFLVLTNSIKEHGVLQPVTVKGGKVISGRRRLEAAKSAGLKQIPAIHVEAGADNAETLIAFVNNVHRKNLNPIEEAKALSALVNKGVVKNRSELAKVLGVTPAAITQKLAVMELSAGLKKALTENRISATAAIELKDADPKIIDAVLGRAKKVGKNPTAKEAKAAKQGKSAVAAQLPEGAPSEIRGVKVTAKGARFVIDIDHPQKSWKKGECGKILAEIAKACGESIDKALTAARKEVE
jgi:ParB family chromosome partitioning protein